MLGVSVPATDTATHSEHRGFPAPPSKLCQIWLRHSVKGYSYHVSVQLSGTPGMKKKLREKEEKKSPVSIQTTAVILFVLE